MAKQINYRIDHVEKKIILNRGYYSKTQNPNNPEAKDFERVRQQHSDYTVAVREPIKNNSAKRTYKDFTFENMERYILSHDNAVERMREYTKMREAGSFYKSRYHVIQKWFLSKYPEVAQFGLEEQQQSVDADKTADAESQHAERKIT